MANKAAGIKPSELVRGGLRSDFNAEFTDLFWDYYTFPGKNGELGTKAFGLHLQFTTDEGEEDEQFYSAGKPEEWAPSDDKSEPIPVVEGRGLNDASNYAQFIRSVIEIGIPESKFSTVKDLVGMNVFMSRVEQPKRVGLDNDGKARTVLVCKRLNRAPWEKKKSAGSRAAKGSPNSSPAADAPAPVATDDEVVAAVSGIISELLASGEYPDGLPMKALFPAVTKKKMLDEPELKPIKPKIIKALMSSSVLGGLQGVTLDNGVLSFA